MLVCLIRSETAPYPILAIRDVKGGELHVQQAFNATFAAHFHKVYGALQHAVQPQELFDYLGTHPLQCFDLAERVSRETPITRQELLGAVRALNPAKSPGSDGLPAEFYKCFPQILLDSLLEVLVEAIDKGELPQSMREVLITVILMPGKEYRETGDTRYCVSKVPKMEAFFLLLSLCCGAIRVVQRWIETDCQFGL
ncbi:hypothetical protein NDU88_001154 [Pleurodeles waltl]|uniref:Uncharacterized protein n=1 Tax=Pleurodeles waltl TaxID=8319 RepID=A0AAV7MJR6_PLEWA|nr:hypothetical protein NDU88_001154 [Pleurodeles waltl]